MEYLDFELRVGAASGTGTTATYPVTVVRSPAGEASATVQFPLDSPEFKLHLQVVEHARGTAARTRRAGDNLRDLVPEDAAAMDEALTTDDLAAMKAIGRALFSALFPSKILSCYRVSLNKMGKDKPLPVRLRIIDAPELATLPWEFLFDEETDDFIAINELTPLTRYIELPRPSESLSIPPPIRILGMVASPRGHVELDVAKEKGWIEAAVEDLVGQGTVELTWVDGQTLHDLEAVLRNKGHDYWHIFHFIGHGGFDQDRGEGFIALVDEADGGSRFVSAHQLGRLLAPYHSIRLAVLNACEGARASKTDIFSSTGTVLVNRGIPAVISMQYEITDAAATDFSRNFYDALARKMPVDAAVREARYRLSMSPKNEREWGTPVLQMHSSDGSLFDLTELSAFSPPTTVSTAASPNDRIPGVRPMSGTDSVPGIPALPPTSMAGETRSALQILRGRVQQYWIEGVLENSLFRKILLELGKERTSNAVNSPLSSLLERPGAASESIPSDKSIADIFVEEGSSLLILGVPGSGKTTTLLGLARVLLARAERELGDPIPVVLNLSSWVEPYRMISEWMADELSGKFQIPTKQGRAWLKESRLLPLLDGLDELQPSARRAACVEAINAFTSEAGPVGIVVCCRLNEYLDLPVRLGLNAAVRLEQLTDEQVQDYLDAAGDRLSALNTALQQESAMRIDARSPLMLNLMVRAYEDLSVEEVLQEGIETTALRRWRLMEAYLARMFRRAAQGWVA